MKRSMFTAAFAAATLVASVAEAATQAYAAALTASPGVTSSGTGSGAFTYDPPSRRLTWSLPCGGMSGPATMPHIPAPDGSIRGPSPPPASPNTGSATLTEAQGSDLAAGKLY